MEIRPFFNPNSLWNCELKLKCFLFLSSLVRNVILLVNCLPLTPFHLPLSPSHILLLVSSRCTMSWSRVVGRWSRRIFRNLAICFRMRIRFSTNRLHSGGVHPHRWVGARMISHTMILAYLWYPGLITRIRNRAKGKKHTKKKREKNTAVDMENEASEYKDQDNWLD